MDNLPMGGGLRCTSTLSGEVNSAETHNTLGMFTPDVPVELKPTVGMTFRSLEEAYEFYNTYAWHCGFSIRKDITRTFKTGEISRRVLTCSKAGFRNGKSRDEHNRKRRASIMTRCSCSAKLQLSLKDKKEMVYHVSHFIETHNHVLCTPTKTRRLRSHKKFTEDDLNLITSLKASGIGVARSIDFMRTDVGGPSHLAFSERDARNALRKQRQRMFCSDASTLLHFFQSKSQIDTGFSYNVQFDDDMRFTSCFWVDGKSKEDYMVFGDVVCFDTTYKTNEYDMPFGPFVGVNHHMQTCIFGAGLLFGETIGDFKWLFQTWLHTMGGIQPMTIITDQDAAMAAAIAEVFPNANHILCLWHIQKKLPEKLSHIIHQHSTFKTTWNHCVYGTKSAEEFESSWHAMIEKFDLHDNSWLQHMFDIRHQWIAAYTNRIFSAGMRTTGRSESINAFFDGFVNHKSSLMDFANEYDKAIERRRETEEEANFQSSNGRPVLKTIYGIEAQMAQLYTFNAFLEFQQEAEESMCYIAERVNSEGVLQAWQVFHFEDHSRKKRTDISWNADDLVASCSCLKFESSGIVCRHMRALFRFVQVVSMPSSHLLPRWMKNVKVQFKHSCVIGDNITIQSRAVREHAFAKSMSSIRHNATCTPVAFEVFKEHMERMRIALHALPTIAEVAPRGGGCVEVGDQGGQCAEVALRGGECAEVEDQFTMAAGDNFNTSGDGLVNVAVHLLGDSRGTPASQSSQACDILDPHIVKTKGRTAKRMK